MSEPGSHYSWRGDSSLGKTSADGTLTLAYPVWVNLDDEVGQISFSVTHPDYATYKDFGAEVAPEIRVVMKMGSVLVVSGWIDEPSKVVTDVRRHFSWHVDVEPEDWLPRRDGRLTTTRVPQGSHIVVLEHESTEHGLCFSAMTSFVLEAGETEELHLQLEPARRLVGRLDESVPRPIVDGQVVLAVQMSTEQMSTEDRRAIALHTFSGRVDADGSFLLDRLMTGDAQIIALCDGWSSKWQSVAVERSGDPGSGAAIEWVSQLVDLRADAGPIVVAMERTAAFEVELFGPDGAPAPDVDVSAWPNACWRVRVCGTFVHGRTWSATTDAEGRARIENIPVGSHSFGVADLEYDLPLEPPAGAPASRQRSAAFASGDTTRVSYTLERKSGE